MVGLNAGEAIDACTNDHPESGMDIPRVNNDPGGRSPTSLPGAVVSTRGVGRSGVQAHACSSIRDCALSEAARAAAAAIQEFAPTGQGYQLAMRDMEIRGRRAICWVKQSGQMETIGFDLYMGDAAGIPRGNPGQDIPAVKDTQIDLRSPPSSRPSGITEADGEDGALSASAAACGARAKLLELRRRLIDR